MNQSTHPKAPPAGRSVQRLVLHFISYPMCWIYPTLLRLSNPSIDHQAYNDYRVAWRKRLREICKQNEKVSRL